MSDSSRPFLLVLAHRFVPASSTLDADGERRFLGIIEEFLASRPALVRRQIGLFLGVLRWLPALRHGRPLDALPSADQDAALRRFQDHWFPLFRKGFWGVKTLVYMGYYGRPEAAESFRYRPSKSGNASLHA
ncbi:MAG: hypothetical protein HYZ53_12200 [Planctomycetes bacterium]|nr:hypothetical protein [Planctomycetota bacterium]